MTSSAKALRAPRSLVEVLRARTELHPQRQAYTFLQNGEQEEQALTYAELDGQARRVAAELQRLGLAGGSALLLFPPGLDFVTAFWGCLYAGVVAIPAYPPGARGEEDTRLKAILGDARPRAVLTTGPLLDRMETRGGVQQLGAIRWLATDRIAGGADDWQRPDLRADSLALLQYTSGSTSTPKGVMVSHANLVHNEEMIRQAFGQSEDSVIVSWLPLYHDMGLIGGMLQPVYVGARSILMSPTAFIQRPARWLAAIHRYRATTSGGPNFAYDLSARRVTEEERGELDLSCWTVAFTGSEPVRADTLRRFARAFTPCGFRPAAFYPCYGMAEATLFVSGGLLATEPAVASFDVEALRHGRALRREAGEGARLLVGCGEAYLGQEIAIVDPETRQACPPGGIGEIWIAGPSVARGYWNRTELSERNFAARRADLPEAGPYLRSGDLGFKDGGQLFISGREKDLIIIRGRNHFPQEIELTGERAHPALRPGCGAAFSIEVADEERLVLVCEIHRGAESQAETAAAAIREAVSREHGLVVHEIQILTPPAAIPKTSSGKVQRYRSRELYLANGFDTLVRSRLAPEPPEPQAPPENGAARSMETAKASALPLPAVSPVRAILLAIPAEYRLPALEADLRQRVAHALHLAPAALDRNRKLTGLGLDSLTAVEIKHEVESALGVDLPLADLIEGPSLAELAVDLVRRISGEGPVAELPVILNGEASGSGEAGEGPLSHGQRALWFVEGLTATTVYSVPAAARVRGPLDVPALRRAFDRLVDRHPALRTTFDDVRGEPRQRVHKELPIGFEVADTTGWDGDRLARRLAVEVERPFDLAAGPLVRLHIFPVGAEENVVLLVVHHLVVDFWSMANLMRDLDLLYREECGGARAALPALPLVYGDYVAWQERLLSGPEGEELWEAWRRELAGEPPTLDMPTDRPRPPVQTYNGAARLNRLPAATTAAIRRLSRAADATPFVTLLAAWQALLGRCSGQREVWVGSPTLGRPRAELLDLVGYFVNPVVLRGDLADDPSFATFLAASRGTVARALRRQDFPFPLLTERLKPVRNPSLSPLFQAMLVYQQAPRAADPALAAFGLGPGPSLRLGELTLESEPLAWRAAYFDLNLIAAEVDGQLWLSLEYNTDLYDGTTAERLLAHLAVLFAGAAATPGERLGNLPLLAASERQQALYEWATGPGALATLATLATLADASRETTVHELFEAQAARTPDTIAVVALGAALSYRELDASADRMARLLNRHGVGPEVRVALHVERNLHLLVGLFGILKAGGTYVPIDPAYPTVRKRFLLEDSGAPVVVTQTSLAREPWLDGVETLCLDQPAIHHQPAGRLNRRSAPGNPAYVIYTSGSTGKPKGVAIEHRSMALYAASAVAEFALAPGDRVLQFTSISFDISCEEIYPCLACGATLVLRDEAMLASIGDFLRTAQRWELTLLDLPTAYWHEICAALARERLALPPALRLVIVAGEQVLRDRLEIWRQATAIPGGAPVPVLNTYGPTEATIVGTWCEICRATEGSGPDLRVPIGRPIPGAFAYVLDRDLAPLPIGTVGELYLGGSGIARGYQLRPDRTAESFLPDPFAERPGARLYRTGDLARHLGDGTLEFLGRFDDQVKVRGFRIELAEIEMALREHPGVAEGVVLAPVEPSGSRRLSAHVVPESGATPTVAELREFLAKRLPDYMVPTAWRFLAGLPLTPNGKIDRRALAASAASGTSETAGEAPGVARASRPATPMEEVVAGIWEEVLGRPRVHPDDNFFEIGGHSLLATQVLSRLREVVRVELLPSQIFQQPTVAGLAQLLEAAGRQTLLPQAPPLRPMPREAWEKPLLLSFAQERLWFLDLMEPGNAWYNIPAAVHLTGRLDPAVLAASLSEVVRRHAVLRTHFAPGEAGPVLVVTPAAPFLLPVVDLTALPAAARAALAHRLAAEEGKQPFDLARGWMVRALLLDEGERAATVLVTMHHIASDGWSLVLFIRELSALYGSLAVDAGSTASRPAPLPELAIQYSDFARWQRRWLTGEVLDAQLAYWRQALAGAPLLLDLPTDRPRGTERSTRGARQGFTLPAGLESDLRALARGQGATLFMLLLATFHAYLSRSSGQDDILTGVPIAGRNRIETEGLIGLFVNTLVVRTRLDGAPSFTQLLSQVRSAALAAYAHQDLPFERLVEDLHPERNLAYAPLFQVMFAYENAPEAALRLADLTLDLVELETGTAKFDFHLTVIEGSGGLTGHVEYRTDLFEDPTAGRMLAGWTTLLTEAVAHPELPVGEIPLLSAAERRQLRDWNATVVARPAGLCLHHLFEAQAVRTPAAAALTFADASLSYGELDRISGQLAGRLQRLGVGPEVVVGLFAERSLEMMAAILGILKAGGAFLPLDTGSPADRLAFMLEDARVTVIVAQRSLAARLPAYGGELVLVDATPDPSPDVPVTFLPVAVDPANLAYVLFTSGSTGRPKGVMSRHAGIVNRLLWVEEICPTPEDCFLQKTPYGFDVSLWEMFWPLATGGRLVVALPGGHQDPAYIARTAALQGITILQFVTSMLRAFLEEPGARGLAAVRQVIASGEALPPDVVRRFLERLPGAVLSNLYGPTEASIEVTWWHCPLGDERDVVPIGRPVANTQIHVQDRDGGAVPVGVRGELLIGGVQIARGYLGRPDLTAERFVPDAFSGELGARVYRSGDLARRLKDGTLDYLGRLDHQVKLRGVRIEPGEIEAALALHPAVRDAVVLAREDRPGDLRLVAYVTPAGESVDVAALRAGLGERLPAHMVPADFVVLDQLPLSVSGKVDRRALPAPERTAAGSHPKAASDPIEELLAGIWAEVLELDRVGVDDNFFDLGGHSLVVIRVLSRLEEALGVALPPRALFEAPTVAALSRTVATLRRARLDHRPAPPLVRLARSEREGPVAPSFAQERLWVMDQLLPDNAVYNVSQTLRISGPLDLSAFEGSLREVVRRHEILRTRFTTVRGRPMQVIEAVPRFDFLRIDLQALPPVVREREAIRLACQETRRPFDLRLGPLLRVAVLQASSPIVLFTLHHTVCDDWSVGILVREVAALYGAAVAGRAAPLVPLPELPVQYADYAAWQREWLTGEVLETELGYWRRQLAGELPVLALPTDRPRPPVQSYRGARRPFALPGTLVAALDELSRRQGTTLFMTVLAAFAAVLGQCAGQEDVIVGGTIAGRNRREVEDLIGCFVNVLPLRIDLSGRPTYGELLARVRQVVLGGFDHRDVPFEKLVEAVQVERSLGHAALRQVALALQDESMRTIELAEGIAAQPLEIESGVTRLDLTLFLWRTAEGISGDCEYSTDLFDDSTIGRLLGFLADLLADLVTGVERPVGILPPLSLRENAGLVALPEPHELGAIEEALTRFPGIRAVVVLVREDRRGDRRLVAYYVPEPGWGPGAQQLRGYLQKKLPAALLPHLVSLKSLPLGPGGQIDHGALPSPA